MRIILETPLLIDNVILSDVVDIARLAAIADKIMAQSDERAVASVSKEKEMFEGMEVLIAKVDALSAQCQE